MTNFATKKGIQEIKRSRMEKTKKKTHPNPETKLVVGQKTTKRILSHILIPLKIQVRLKGSQISDLWLFATFNIQSLLPLLPTAIILGFVLPSKNLSLKKKKVWGGSLHCCGVLHTHPHGLLLLLRQSQHFNSTFP